MGGLHFLPQNLTDAFFSGILPCMEGENADDIVLEEDDSSEGAEAVAKLRARLKKAVADKQEYLDGWQRARADFQNEKRAAAERLASVHASACAQAAEKILPLVDAFDMAFATPSWATLDASFRTGIERLREEALKALKELGVEAFSPMGESFDPNTMSAVREMEGPEGVVVSVERQGFRMGDRIIRVAYVGVGK